MKPCYLIDPWLVELKADDSTEVRFNRLTALRQLKTVHVKYGMKPVKFIDRELRESILNNHHNFQRQEWAEVGRLISHIVLSNILDDRRIKILDSPFPSLLPAQWINALAESGRDSSPPNWRTPAIVFSGARTSSWPNPGDSARELNYEIVGTTKPIARNLVCIERYDEHTYFEPDLDPWRIGVVGTLGRIASGAIGERRESSRRLPRPLHRLPLDLTLTEIVEELQNRMDWSCDEKGKAYFLPSQAWDPRIIDRDDWRENEIKIFPSGTVMRGGKKIRGNVDRNGRIWLWDPKENHWDVQWPGGDYTRVSQDGTVLDKKR